MSTTTAGGLPVPTTTDDPDVPGDMLALANALDKVTMPRFANGTTRDAAFPSPLTDQKATVAGLPQRWNGTSWRPTLGMISAQEIVTYYVPSGTVAANTNVNILTQNITTTAPCVLEVDADIELYFAGTAAGFFTVQAGGKQLQKRFNAYNITQEVDKRCHMWVVIDTPGTYGVVFVVQSDAGSTSLITPKEINYCITEWH